jgi:periplasmic divalent cation tolerance protein
MSSAEKHVVIFITCVHYNEADKVAGALVKEKLVAGVNILLHSESIFWWQKKIERASEIVIIAKTASRLLPQVIKLVKELHSYEVPEIIALPVIGGSDQYLDWIENSVKSKGGKKHA